jgi:integrase/recombinase XerD
MQANAYLSTNEKIKLTPHMLRHSFLKRVADKHGLHVAQNLSGNVSIKEIFRYTKPDNSERYTIVEELF